MNKKAFTLIELLVVVLIIGILAAIALPMYTKTVEKSRAVNAVVWVKTTADSVQRFLMENPSYEDSLYGTENQEAMLDVTPATNIKGFECNIGDRDGVFFPFCMSSAHNYYIIQDVFPDGRMSGPFCDGEKEEPSGDMCKMLGYTKETTVVDDTTNGVCMGSLGNGFGLEYCWTKP